MLSLGTIVGRITACGKVADLALIYPAGATAPQKATINAALAALGIVIRTGV